MPDWGLIGHVRPPAGAPNVLVVLIDDAAFGNPGAFGGPLATPNYDRMAAQGLRYNRFHVTAMCSPTRAALLTGRHGRSPRKPVPTRCDPPERGTNFAVPNRQQHA